MAVSVGITGAFSYTGKYATRLLLNRGYEVRTLTNHPPALLAGRIFLASACGFAHMTLIVQMSCGVICGALPL